MKIYLDTNVVMHSATEYRTQDIYFGGARAGEPLIRRGEIEVIKKRKARDPKLRQQIEALPELAGKLKDLGVEPVMDYENFIEIRRAGRFRKEYFYGSEIKASDRAPQFRTLVGGSRWMNSDPTENLFHNFLDGLKNKRFIQIAKQVGAFQGTYKKYNQLADAYFLWCAELNKVDYFLTLDFNLQKYIHKASRLEYIPQVITPTELLNVLQKS
ncbi:hypothetical protein [Marinobacterium rhizophilum]|uniref:hypothetical protein n=1 Tax=Marinobacterium rhizophilum TaxID=420402 RepID=UPI0003819C12|nr:hypothetical protein [Marinobacterium rhizophilum]